MINDIGIRRLAAMKANLNKDKLVIISKCGCKHKKEMHHPDYSKPLEIKLLCKNCHMAEHHKNNGKKPNSFGKYPNISIIANIFGISQSTAWVIYNGKARLGKNVSEKISKATGIPNQWFLDASVAEIRLFIDIIDLVICKRTIDKIGA